MEHKNQFVGLPFYVFITLILGVVATIGIRFLWNEGMTLQLALFTATIILHLGVYWLYVKWYSHPHIHFFFYPVQTLLILGVFFILRGTNVAATVIGAMVITMIGESIGLWGNTWRALYLSLFYATFGVLLVYFLVAWDQLGNALLALSINGGFVVTLLILFNRQLAEQQKATELAETLESANAKLTAYTARIEQLTLQNERQRMARELHDTLAQGVAGLSLQLEAVKMHLKAGRSDRALAIAEQAITRAHNTLADSRAVIENLRTEPENLATAVCEKVERFTQATGIPCPIELALDKHPLPVEITDHALRVLNEALTNIARHAQATQAAVKFTIQKDCLTLEIRDNGIGFDVSADTEAGHYGLVGMRERARLTGGALTIESEPESGTTVRFVIPM